MKAIFLILTLTLYSSFNPLSINTSQESYSFTFSKYDRVGLNGSTVINKSTIDQSGSIQFNKNQIRLKNGVSEEIFTIEKCIKQVDGYQINTLDSKGNRCMIGVIKRQGIDFVIFHYLDKSSMLMHHISAGFNLNMNICN